MQDFLLKPINEYTIQLKHELTWTVCSETLHCATLDHQHYEQSDINHRQQSLQYMHEKYFPLVQQERTQYFLKIYRVVLITL